VVEVTTSTKLPKNLAGAKPRYSISQDTYLPRFDSDFDLAAYIVTQAKPSKNDADYLNWAVEASGMTPEEVRKHGLQVRAQIKQLSRQTKGGTSQKPAVLTVPAVRITMPEVKVTATPVSAPVAAPVTPAPTPVAPAPAPAPTERAFTLQNRTIEGGMIERETGDIITFAKSIAGKPKERSGYPKYSVKADGQSVRVDSEKALEKILQSIASGASVRVFRNSGKGVTLDFDQPGKVTPAPAPRRAHGRKTGEEEGEKSGDGGG
jgi:hypothetical protein